MADVEVDIRIDEVKKAMESQMDVALKAVGLEAEGDAKIEVEADPRRVDTGRLRNSITHTVIQEGDEHYAVIGTDVEYAVYVHEGTGIHASEGGGRQTPWAYMGSDGKMHYTHGMKPNRFLRNAIERNRDKYNEILKSMMSKEG